mmetsp:Transcript_2049/g.3445  ORF Transcript_2049/g.3445 Transcript_2049/m.3445 type:complete len:220 (-) Transcript_2049:1551-2210(-)
MLGTVGLGVNLNLPRLDSGKPKIVVHNFLLREGFDLESMSLWNCTHLGILFSYNLWLLHVVEGVLDQLLHLERHHVAYNYHGCVLWHVKLVVVVLDALARNCLYRLSLPDGNPIGQPMIGKKVLHLIKKDLPLHTIGRSILGKDNSPFYFYFFLRKESPVCKVAKDAKDLVGGFSICIGQVDIVDGLIEGSIRVAVSAQTLKSIFQLGEFWKVLRSGEN